LIQGEHLGLSSCFNTEPAGYATCVGRTEPPILEFDPSGELLASFGSEMFAFPHGFTVDAQGNIWASDANASETVLGLSAKDSNGVVRGHQVFKMSSTGKVLMTIARKELRGAARILSINPAHCHRAQRRYFCDPTATKERPRSEVFEGRQVHQDLGTSRIGAWRVLTNPTTSPSAVREATCTLPTEATVASRCSTKMEILLSRGNNLAGRAPCIFRKTTLYT